MSLLKPNKTESILQKIIIFLTITLLLQLNRVYGQGTFMEVADLPYVSTDIAFDEEGNRYVSLQQGVLLKNNDTLLTVPVWFLNEMGLVAVLPYEDHIYLHYSGLDTIQRVVRYDTSLTIIDTILEVRYTHPYSSNHHGGDLVAYDGFLYSSFGYGGQQNDAQDPNELRGKIVATDLEDLSSTIYASGLRNPFRMAIDEYFYELWVADVGSNIAEEVNIVMEGDNLGWPCFEGDSLRVDSNWCGQTVFPIHSYSQDQPRYIIGGTFLNNSYYWADAGSGNGGIIDTFLINDSLEYPNDLTSMALDPTTNTLYAINWLGEIFEYVEDTTVLAIPEWVDPIEPPKKEKKEIPFWYFNFCEGYVDRLGRKWATPPKDQFYFDCQDRKWKHLIRD